MDRLSIQGGAPLKGSVKTSGAKNAALPLLAASLLTTGEHQLRNVPDLADVRTMIRLLSRIGAYAHRGSGHANDRVTIEVSEDVQPVADYDLVKTMRASVLVLGPLVARWGWARVSLPGGCAIGARPIDQHLKGLKALGAEIDLSHGYVEAKAKRLRGARVSFDMPTVTGTENILMAAVLAKGDTLIENAAREPEVVDLAQALRTMGAKIEGEGSSQISVEGIAPDELRPMKHQVLPDRIEAGTFAVAAAITGGEVLIERCRPVDLGALIACLQEAGAKITETENSLLVRGPKRPHPVQIQTAPHPGFPTDMQAQMMALASVAKGDSVFRETVFENRYMHVSELSRMGAEIEVDGRTALVSGRSGLSGAEVMATDLRASACLVLAALRAEGNTIIHRVYHLDRGYDRLERKLRGIGATIRRMKN